MDLVCIVGGLFLFFLINMSVIEGDNIRAIVLGIILFLVILVCVGLYTLPPEEKRTTTLTKNLVLIFDESHVAISSPKPIKVITITVDYPYTVLKDSTTYEVKAVGGGGRRRLKGNAFRGHKNE